MQPFRPSAVSRPATPDSPRFEKESHIGSELSARQAREAADAVLRDYEEKQARWVQSLLWRCNPIVD